MKVSESRPIDPMTIVFVIFMIGLLYLLYLIIFKSPSFEDYQFPKCLKTEDRVISSLGGCDRGGRCGVGFTDGTFGFDYYPVVGNKASVCIEWEQKKGK